MDIPLRNTELSLKAKTVQRPAMPAFVLCSTCHQSVTYILAKLVEDYCALDIEDRQMHKNTFLMNSD